jgi:hypothetical protein
MYCQDSFFCVGLVSGSVFKRYPGSCDPVQESSVLRYRRQRAPVHRTKPLNHLTSLACRLRCSGVRFCGAGEAEFL